MKIDPIALFSNAKEIAAFSTILFLIFFASLGREYYQYKNLTRFDDARLDVTVLKHYHKSKEGRSYAVMKVRTSAGATFYMSGSKALRPLQGYDVSVWIRTDKISFKNYLLGFYAPGYVRSMAPHKQLKYRVADAVMRQHHDADAATLFAALLTASALNRALQQHLGELGISHLLAISGFHIGLLGLLLFAIFKYPYGFLHDRYFPWRSAHSDLFVLAALPLAGYVLFLGMTPSVLRAYAMLLVGFLLYTRGIKVLSQQTLLIAAGVLIALWPRLLFSAGFWLSVAGVLYIVLFVQRFQGRGKAIVFVGLHFWVYLMMLPITLSLFGTFSTLHPLSVLWTMAFVLFYPLTLLLHLLGYGGLMDPIVKWILNLPLHSTQLSFGTWPLLLWGALTLMAIKSEFVKRLMLALAIAVFVGAVYQVA